MVIFNSYCSAKGQESFGLVRVSLGAMVPYNIIHDLSWSLAVSCIMETFYMYVFIWITCQAVDADALYLSITQH